MVLKRKLVLCSWGINSDIKNALSILGNKSFLNLGERTLSLLLLTILLPFYCRGKQKLRGKISYNSSLVELKVSDGCDIIRGQTSRKLKDYLLPRNILKTVFSTIQLPPHPDIEIVITCIFRNLN